MFCAEMCSLSVCVELSNPENYSAKCKSLAQCWNDRISIRLTLILSNVALQVLLICGENHSCLVFLLQWHIGTFSTEKSRLEETSGGHQV